MKVWAVFSGHYSDRGLDAIFSTEEKAKAYIKMMQYDRWHDINDRPQEYELDVYEPIEYVYFSVDEDTEQVYTSKTWCQIEDDVSVSENGDIIIKVKYNESEEVMEKAARDKYYMWKAHQEGIA